MRKIYRILILALVLCIQPVKAQYNPYLKKKARNKPSAIMARQNKKEIKRQKRTAKKQMRRSRKRTGR